jgi:dipeptidyl-peptidase-4
MKRLIITGFTILAVNNLCAQKKQISLEDIHKNNTFRSKAVYGLSSMNDGIHYTTLESPKSGTVILRFEYAKSSAPDTILKQSEFIDEGKALPIETYSFSADESKVLVATGKESIYRHSTKEFYYVIDLKSKKVTPINRAEKQMYGSFSPDGNMVGYVRGNNIYILDLVSGKEMQVTKDGKFNHIINGATDWVHEEEFAFSRAFFWSSDSKKIAYYKFDESKVKEFSFTEFNQALYPTEYKFKYPKAGEANSVVSIHTFDIAAASDKTMDVGTETDQYIPRIRWTADPNTLSILRMNRHQNKLDLLFAEANTGKTKVIYSESNKSYLNIHESEGDYAHFTADNKSFFIMSEKDGFNHLYRYDMKGTLINQVTKGNWEVVKLQGIDEKSGLIYYTASESTATEKDIYSVKFDGTAKTKISEAKGTHVPQFSKGMKYYVDTYSDANRPPVFVVCNSSGKQIRVMEDNEKLAKVMQDYELSKKELFMFKTSEGVDLNGWIMKPANFDASVKYPVLLTFYGGPGRTMVNNSFDTRDYFWHQMLNQKGYIVVCVDNRGTQYRGKAFMESTYKQLGKLEVADQIEAAKYLGSLPWVDKTRIGTFGWSFGGFLSSLCITKGADYFKAAIAVAPVTNWRYYDNIYTERFLALPQENPTGYDENSPINHVSKLKGKYLLIHGSGDDNVHVQNTMEMVNALVAANKQFDLFIYPDRNHSIIGGNTKLHLYTKMTDFILNNL